MRLEVLEPLSAYGNKYQRKSVKSVLSVFYFRKFDDYNISILKTKL